MIGNDPDGLNINDGVGSTHLENVASAVRAAGADLGIAHDGDADRCLAVDAEGRTVDGDQIMAILATSMARRRVLLDDVLVATVMSNLGLKLAMADAGIRVIETSVGDRYVLEAMNDGGYSLGGEQSGHVIMSRYATTGDGVLTGLQLAAEMARTGRSIAELAAVMAVFPQTLVNVRGVDREGVHDDAVIASAIADAETELGSDGRVLLRPSGTEPMVRVMVEAKTQETADRLAGALADVVLERLRSRSVAGRAPPPRTSARRIASGPEGPGAAGVPNGLPGAAGYPLRPRSSWAGASDLAQQHRRDRVIGLLAQDEARARARRTNVLHEVRLVDG